MSLFTKKKSAPIVMAAEKSAPKKVIKRMKKKTIVKAVAPKKVVAKAVAPKKIVKKAEKKVVAKNAQPKKIMKKAVKVVAKKAISSKKPMQRKMTVSMIEIQPEQFFWIYDGIALRDLRDLHEALREMSQEQFDFHTNREGNDFAKWIEGVFGEVQLARKIEKARTREALANLIANHIK